MFLFTTNLNSSLVFVLLMHLHQGQELNPETNHHFETSSGADIGGICTRCGYQLWW